MKNILCFGDSNTYGFNPSDGSRYSENIRWTGLLKQDLKNKYSVIEAGCNNRTCFSDCADGIEQTGYKSLPLYLNNSIDILILALGINDIQKFYNPTILDIEKGLEKIIIIANNINPKIKIILVSPAVLTNDILNGNFSFQFDNVSIEKSLKLSEIYQKIAKKYNCIFVDLSKHVSVSKTDGLHYDKQTHKTISSILSNVIQSI